MLDLHRATALERGLILVCAEACKIKLSRTLPAEGTWKHVDAF